MIFVPFSSTLSKIKTFPFAPLLNICSFSTGNSGDIRGAGGSFGKKEKAQEEQYFWQKEKEELAEFKKKQEEAAEAQDKNKTKPKNKPSSGSSSSSSPSKNKQKP